MYGAAADLEPVDWARVDEQLTSAGAYWLVTSGSEIPHPRPVWGIWHSDALFLSIGSPRLAAGAVAGRPVTVHLGSVNDVVIVEGTAGGTADDAQLLDAYNQKYDWDYTVAEYGPLVRITPSKVIAWRSGGWAGREGFQAASRWRFPSADDMGSPPPS